MERPTTIRCQAQLGDGTFCGVEVPVGRQGNIPKYCVEHRDQYLRKQLAREWQRTQALAEEAPDQATDALDPGEQVPGEAGEAHRVCRARSCSIPLTDEWLNEFCPAHWRLLGGTERAELVGSRADEELHNTAILRALRAIARFETGVDSVTGKP